MKTKKSALMLVSNFKKMNNYGINRVLVQLEKELNIYYSCQNKKNIKKKALKLLKQKNKLQIGGGKHYLPSFINIDINKPADIIFDVRNGIPLPSNSVNFIFCEHFLEHIDYPVSVKKFINEAYRVLEVGGILVIGVPDSSFVIGAYYNNNRKVLNKIKSLWYKNRKIFKDINSSIDLVNLVIKDEDADVKYNPHYWGFDKNNLSAIMVSLGFKEIRNWKFDSKIANKKRKFASLYLAGVK